MRRSPSAISDALATKHSAMSFAPFGLYLAPVSMAFDPHAIEQPAIPLPCGERWTCWLDLSETRSSCELSGGCPFGPGGAGIQQLRNVFSGRPGWPRLARPQGAAFDSLLSPPKGDHAGD